MRRLIPMLLVPLGAILLHLAAPSEPAARTATLSQPTPIVEPGAPPPRPLYLPALRHGFDARAPGALSTRLVGFVGQLEDMGRQACHPATHALTDRPLGEPNPTVTAVLVQTEPDPRLALDLYVGEYVAVTGPVTLANERCRPVTWRQLDVRRIEQLELPPGRRDPGPTPGG